MNDSIKYYYNLGAVEGVVDIEITNFKQLEDVLDNFRKAYEEKDDKKYNSTINLKVNSSINCVDNISAYYNLKRGFFSKKIKTDEFLVQIHKIENDGKSTNYIWCTNNFEEFKLIFYEFIVNQQTPNFNNWTKNIFMSD